MSESERKIIAVPIVLHLPADAPMVDLARELSQLADRFDGGWWEYRHLPGQDGAFHVHAERREVRPCA
ncbi:MAG: hypothetical protein U1F59_09830 [Candidatus Competibacteraceae bacterium]